MQREQMRNTASVEGVPRWGNVANPQRGLPHNATADRFLEPLPHWSLSAAGGSIGDGEGVRQGKNGLIFGPASWGACEARITPDGFAARWRGVG